MSPMRARILRTEFVVAIGGVGLVGGSLGLRLKSLSPAPRVVAFGRSESTLRQARERGAIDHYELDPAAAVRGADLVLLAAPVRAIPGQMTAIGAGLKPGAVVTDAGSTKAWITAEAARRLPPHAHFVGSHPLAGSEKSGVAHASASLFEQAIVVLTPSPSSDETSLLMVRTLWELAGAHVLVLQPEAHDRIVAAVSHLPQLTASALVNAVSRLAQATPRTLDLAASGFRDTTRIAASPADMWLDICMTNREALLAGLDRLREELQVFGEALSRGDEALLAELFRKARDTREKVPPRGAGLLPAFSDLFVSLPDRPGAIAEITGVLGQEKLNIVDIAISHLRDASAPAPLRLFFADETSRDQAAQVLAAAGYQVHRPGDEAAS